MGSGARRSAATGRRRLSLVPLAAAPARPGPPGRNSASMGTVVQGEPAAALKVFDTCVLGVADDVLIWVHTSDRLDEGDWRQAIGLAEGLPSIAALVVFTASAKLHAGQRRDISRLYAQHHMKMCVLTTSAAARAGLTALRWFGVQSRTFEPHDLRGALRFAGRSSLEPSIRAMLDRHLPA